MKHVLSPVAFLMDTDIDSLKSKLESMDMFQLRKIISFHHMDPTGAFRNRNKDWCISKIIAVSDTRSRKGDAFRNL